jgi:hypothetical protein
MGDDGCGRAARHDAGLGGPQVCVRAAAARTRVMTSVEGEIRLFAAEGWTASDDQHVMDPAL